MIFKGYVQLDGKKSLTKFKTDDTLLTYEQVKNTPGFGGVLADGIILIDVDDSDDANILYSILEQNNIQCPVLKTDRGMHFYFTNTTADKCGTNVRLALGINADIKVGTSYAVLKKDGVPRIFINSENTPTPLLPKFLTPISSKINFKELDAGEGRNNALFGYILPLQAEGFSVEEARQTITLINDYILKDPLSSDELDVILREDSFKKELFFNKKTFLFDVFAKYIVSNHYVKKINGQLHVFNGKIYTNDTQIIENKMIKHIPNLKQAQRKEVMSYINLIVETEVYQTDENLIAFRNGVYNIITDELLPFSPEYFITNIINWDYNPHAYDELLDKTLNKISCNDKEIRSLLEEMVGYTFYRRNELRKAFILVGDTVNGKSTYLDCVSTLLGYENISALDLSEMDQRFKTVELYGKLANIGDDIEGDYISNTSIFKKLVSGDRLNVERKGQDPFDFSNYSKLIFSANNIPKLGNGKDSKAISNRIIIIPFNATFSRNDPDFDPFIKYKLQRESSIEYLIQLALKGLMRIIERNNFTFSIKAENALKQYEKESNPLYEFIDEVGDIENCSSKEIYNQYKEYCLINNYKPLAHNSFSKQINTTLGLETSNRRINGRQMKIFVKKGLQN